MLDIFEKNKYGYTKMEVVEVGHQPKKEDTWDIRPVVKTPYTYGGPTPEDWVFDNQEAAKGALNQYNLKFAKQHKAKMEK